MKDIQHPTVGKSTTFHHVAATLVSVSPNVPALDGLRGLAIAGVLLFHTGNLDGGFLGVDLFFVLSGFLITSLLLREVAASGRVSLVSFWSRRLRRLFPALAVLLAVVAVSVWAIQRTGVPHVDSGMLNRTLSDGLWSQLNLLNWYLLAQNASYWDDFGQSRVFEHLWSIAVEEQFYAVWPLLVAATLASIPRAQRLNERAFQIGILVVTVALSISSLVAMIVLWDPVDPTRVYTGTDTRAFSLLLGAAVATEPARRALCRLNRCVTTALVMGLSIAILAFWAVADGTEQAGLFTGGLFVHACACAVLIGLVAEATAERYRTGGVPASVPIRILEARPARWLGGISYSLYLWHWPVIVLLPSLIAPGVSPWLITTLAIGIALILACASKYLVEDPIRFRAAWARGWKGAVIFVIASAALLTLWSALPMPESVYIDTSRL